MSLSRINICSGFVLVVAVGVTILLIVGTYRLTMPDSGAADSASLRLAAYQGDTGAQFKLGMSELYDGEQKHACFWFLLSKSRRDQEGKPRWAALTEAVKNCEKSLKSNDLSDLLHQVENWEPVPDR